MCEKSLTRTQTPAYVSGTGTLDHPDQWSLSSRAADVILPHRVFNLFVGTRQRQDEDRACMKRRCFPVKGDHNLLTPDAQTLSGVSLRPQVHSEGVASLSEHLSDSSSSKLATALTRRRLSASPTRRLRFEDETEMEAESRYLERQRRTGVLMSKPHLNLYVNGTAGAVLREAGHVADGQHRSGHSDICRTVGGVNLDLHLHPSVFDCSGRSFNRHCLNLRTEPIRETYIGSVTSAERGRAGCVSHMQVRRRVNQVELHEPQMILPQATPSTDLPRNPYEPLRVEAPTQPSVIGTATVKSHSPISWPPQHNYIRAEMNQNQNQKEQGRATATKSHREHQSGSQVKEHQPFVEVDNPNTSSDTTAESQAPPKSCSAEGQPVGTELYSDDTSCPAHFSCRDEPSRLSLRRLFSSVRLSRTRTASLDRFSSRPHSSTSDPAPPGSRTSSGLLKKSPSAQLLSEQGSPVLQLKKSLSAQNFASDQNKKTDRSSDYAPTATQFLPRSLSVEDVGRPCSVRSVGRVLQVCSDGTVLLELHRPSGRTFGFIISRGRGRANSGVYVEDMADSAVEKLLAGLLAVGDEIVEVDGERVSSLSLDKVTQLLSQNSSTTLRVLRHQGTSPW